MDELDVDMIQIYLIWIDHNASWRDLCHLDTALCRTSIAH